MRNRLELKNAAAEMNLSTFAAPLEIKLAPGAQGDEGIFEGYGSVFGNVDKHGDVIVPGAFIKTIAEHKAAGTMPAMYVEHGPSLGGDSLPAGKWLEMSEDSRGLQLKGKISGATTTDYGRRIRELVKDDALSGLSIGFRPTDFERKAAPDGRKRTLKGVSLREVSLVTDPSNGSARVEAMKAAEDFTADAEGAARALGEAIMIQDRRMSGSYYSDSGAKDLAVQMDYLREAYYNLTGTRTPSGLTGWTKSAPTIRELEKTLREEAGLSRNEAESVSRILLKSIPRDEGGRAEEDLGELSSALSGFSLLKR